MISKSQAGEHHALQHRKLQSAASILLHMPSINISYDFPLCLPEVLIVFANLQELNAVSSQQHLCLHALKNMLFLTSHIFKSSPGW